MEAPASLCISLLLLTSFLSFSEAYKFYAGGRDGWVLNPSEEYNHWAGRNRFQVNDTIFFKYKKGTDSVLVVTADDYNKCNKSKPILKLEDGDSVFQFHRSGPFFFISGKDDNCQKGQKLIVVVLAIRYPKATPPPAKSPTPPAPVSKPPISAPVPSMAPQSPPSLSPTPSIAPESPSPVAETPSLTPTVPSMAPQSEPSLTPVPSIAPESPSPEAPKISPVPALSPQSPSPVSESPAGGPGAFSPGSGSGSSEIPSASPSTDTGDVTSPTAPGKSGSWVLAPRSVLTSVTVGMSVMVIGRIIGAF